MKKYIFIGISALILLLIIILMIPTDKIIDENMEVYTIQTGSIKQFYRYYGDVDGENIYLNYDGVLKRIIKHENETVKKDETILIYLDSENNDVEFKAPNDSIILEITSGYVLTKNYNYFIRALLPYEKFSLINVNDICSICIRNNDYLAKIYEKKNIGIVNNGKVLFEVLIKGEIPDLMINQKVNIQFNLPDIYGLVIPKDFCYRDDNGYFVIKETVKDHLRQYEKDIVRIQVIDEYENLYLIEGIELENMNVVKLSEPIREVLFDD